MRGPARDWRGGLLLAACLAGGVAPAGGITPAAAGRILVPESMTLGAAILAALPGDTVSIAGGPYDRVPPPFTKAITLAGRLPAEPPLLRGLSCGDCRLVDLRFESEFLTGTPDGLVVATGSLAMERCALAGGTSLGVRIDDTAAASPWQVTFDDCRFTNLARPVEIRLGDAGTRVTLTGCTLSDLMDGIRLEAPERVCPPAVAPSPPPPPFLETEVRLRLVDCTIETVTGTAIEARHAASALEMVDCVATGYGRGIDLFRAGARLVGTQLNGGGGAAVGLAGHSSRVELESSWIRRHAIGIQLDRQGECERNEGILGGDLPRSCGLEANTTSIDTTDPLSAEYNWWGSVECAQVLADMQGQAVRFIVDEFRSVAFDCAVPVRPVTWSRLKHGPEGR